MTPDRKTYSRALIIRYEPDGFEGTIEECAKHAGVEYLPLLRMIKRRAKNIPFSRVGMQSLKRIYIIRDENGNEVCRGTDDEVSEKMIIAKHRAADAVRTGCRILGKYTAHLGPFIVEKEYYDDEY